MKTKATVMGLAAAAVLATAGCRGTALHSDAATQASQGARQVTPLVVNRETVDVLTNQGVVDARVLASALESVQDQGSVIYVDHQGIVRAPDGSIFVDPEGRTVRLRTVTIAKLNSMHALKDVTGVQKMRWIVGGRGYLSDLPPNQQYDTGAPEALRLEVDNVATVAAVSPMPDIIRARVEERTAILAGLSDVLRETYVGENRRVELLADGLVRVVTATGQTIEGVLVAASPAGAGVAGIRMILQDEKTGQLTSAIVGAEE
jgi:hypothetical protein